MRRLGILKKTIKNVNFLGLKDKINYNTYKKFSIIIEWLTDYFIPTVGVIEENVLSAFIEEFNENFKEWF